MAYLHDVDPDTPLQQLLKAVSADPLLAARLRRKLGVTSTTRQLEQRIATLQTEITLAKAVVASMPYRRPPSSNGGNSNHNDTQ